MRKVLINLILGNLNIERYHMYSSPYARVSTSDNRFMVCRHPQLKLGLELKFLAVQLSCRYGIVTRKLFEKSSLIRTPSFGSTEVTSLAPFNRAMSLFMALL